MSATDPFGFSFDQGTDPTTGTDSPGAPVIINTGSLPLPTTPTFPGSTAGTPGTPTGPTQSGSGFNLNSLLGPGATALGSLLQYLANNQRNNLLQQQISNNNQLIQADQARRDYYSSLMMPSIMAALHMGNPQAIQGAQGALNQSTFPGALTGSGTTLTSNPSGTPGTTGTTGTTGTSGGVQPGGTLPGGGPINPPIHPLPTGFLTNRPGTGVPVTGTTSTTSGATTSGAAPSLGNTGSTGSGYSPGLTSLPPDAGTNPGTPYYPYNPVNPNGLPTI